jgi:diguanylate cyclase (GGDEF)-like protein
MEQLNWLPGEIMSGQQTEFVQQVFDDLKRRQAGGRDFAGNTEILQAVRDLEAASTAVPVRAAIAAARSEDIERLALLDHLTELYNYKTFLKELKAEVNRARRYKHSVSLCMFTIDNYESIREKFGQLTAESVLRVVGNVLRGAVREEDSAGKYSEETFCVVLPSAQAASAAMVSERIRQRIGNQFITHNGQNFSVTASVGVASLPAHANSHDELIARSIEALEHASSRGGDRVFCV